MDRDELELRIAEYASGSLAGPLVVETEDLLRRDESARELLREYRALDGMLAAVPDLLPLPLVEWGQLAEQISAAIDRQELLGTLAMPEEVEFALAQYADGTLPSQRTMEVEARLAEDPGARLLVAEYTALEGAFASWQSKPLPEVRWDRLASHISKRIVAHDAVPESYPIFPGLVQRGVEGVRAAFHSPIWIAAAASILLAVGIAFRVIHPAGGPSVTGSSSSVQTQIAEVTGPSAEATSGAAVAEITIGASAGALADMSGFSDDFVTRPARAIVAGASPTPIPETTADASWTQ